MRGRCCGCCRTACLDRLFLLFPDPWPKARHAKRRFVHPALLPLLARVLKPGAEWRVASDDPTYQAWVAEVMAEQTLFDAPAPVTERPPDWPPTRYEAKALREGRTPRYWTFVRRAARAMTAAVSAAPAARSTRAATTRPESAAATAPGIQSAVNSAASPCTSGASATPSSFCTGSLTR